VPSEATVEPGLYDSLRWRIKVIGNFVHISVPNDNPTVNSYQMTMSKADLATVLSKSLSHDPLFNPEPADDEALAFLRCAEGLDEKAEAQG
jgi:hypothetical protein